MWCAWNGSSAANPMGTPRDEVRNGAADGGGGDSMQIADDVIVWVRDGASPWRTKQLRAAVEELAA
jgi:hypothetical protein